VKVGVSSCLVGQPVRFDGGHKRHEFVVDLLGSFVDYVPVCPEIELGLGAPRDTLRLIRRGQDVRMVMANGADYTDEMRAYARRRVEQLAGDDLDGYILKRDSPSCGMARVKVHGDAGPAERTGRGLFAHALLARLPLLPVEEEGRLSDPLLRENFIERLFAYRRLKDLFQPRWTTGALVAFHTAHKLVLLAHSPEAYRSLGRMVAAARRTPRASLRDGYQQQFMGALAVVTTRARHANVLQHMAGYFRDRLPDGSRHELADAIEEYRRGRLPLIVPITLVKHHVRVLDVGYLAGQIYLQPHPRELMLRNHV
jgi:uncharacterized protein YbgA (DUF1722 family)/uncharacterized protein YbbK (DUF523 family)